MGSFRLDLRYALRLIRKNPLFTATIVTVLAFGIGANAAIYSVVDAVLVQALPGHKASEIVSIYSTEQKGGSAEGTFSYPEFREYRENLTSLSGIAAYRPVTLQLSQADSTAQRVAGEMVSGSFFDILGVDAKYGRLLSSADDGARGTNPVAVLSERYWKQQFAGRPDAIGSVLRINGTVFTVVGVAPKAIQEFERTPQVWVPLSMAVEAEPMMATQIARFGNDFFHLVARLKPDVSLAAAQAELDLVSARLGSGQTMRLWDDMEGQVVSPSNKPPTANGQWEMFDWKKPWARLAPARTGFSTEESKLAWLLLCVAALVLLVAAADVVGLFAARAEDQQKEFAIRASLGATRWTLLRQRLVQGLLLGGLAASAGLFAAWWAAKVLFASAPDGLPLPVGIASSVLNVRVVALVLGMSTLTAIGFSLLTALHAKPQNLAARLKRQRGSWSSGARRGSSTRAALVIGQIVASIILVVGAALLLQTMRNIARLDLGFDTDHVLSATLDLSRDGYSKQQGTLMLQPILDQMRSLPGADSVALVGGNPVRWQTKASRAGQTVCNNVSMVMVSPDYFRTLQIPLLRGRDFMVRDKKDAPGAVILNEAAAKLCWPGDDPIGKTYPRLLTVPKPFTVVGIVGNVRVDEAVEAPRPQMYTPLAQFYDALPWQFPFSVLVRTKLQPHALAAAITAQIRALDPKMIPYDVQTPRELLERAYEREEFFTRILGAFGALALVLAIAGLYGLLSYLTSKRAKEFGVRMALGALPRQILQLVLAHGGRLVATGVALGLLAAAGTTRVLKSLLFGVSPLDLRIFLLASVPFLVTGLLACLLPARRAASLDPMVALRDE